MSITEEIPSDLPNVRQHQTFMATFMLFLHRENMLVQYMELTRMMIL